MLRNLVIKCLGRPWLRRWSSRLFGAFGGEGFLPTDIGNLAGWWRADLGVTTVGSDVSDWADQSGNGKDFAQSTASARPLLVENEVNNKPVLRGDGTGDWMYYTPDAIVPGDSPKTFFLVVNPATTGANETVLMDGAGSEGSGSGRAVIFFLRGAGDTAGSFGGSQHWSFSSPDDEWHDHIYYQTGTNMNTFELRIDNGAEETKIGEPSIAADVGPNASIFAMATIDDTVNGFFLSGDIAEIIAYSRELTDVERTSVHDYLADRYAL